MGPFVFRKLDIAELCWWGENGECVRSFDVLLLTDVALAGSEGLELSFG